MPGDRSALQPSSPLSTLSPAPVTPLAVAPRLEALAVAARRSASRFASRSFSAFSRAVAAYVRPSPSVN